MVWQAIPYAERVQGRAEGWVKVASPSLTQLDASARVHSSCAGAIRSRTSQLRRDEAAAPVARAVRSKGPPPPPPRPAAGGWAQSTAGAEEVLESRTRGATEPRSAEPVEPEAWEAEAAPEPMELDDEAPPLGSQWDKAAGRTATATETVVLPLGPPPHALGGMVTQAIAAARRDELGLVERAPALEREERVAVGSSVAWAKMTDVEELRDRGRAEATERKALAKRADTLERNQMTLEGQVKQLRAERDALRVDKAAAEKRERERAKAERAAGKKGALPIEVFDAARKICTENGLQCAARLKGARKRPKILMVGSFDQIWGNRC